MDHRPVRRVASLLGTLGLMLAMLVAGALTAPAAAAAALASTAPTAPAAVSAEATFTAKLNAARSERGVPRLVTRAALVTIARAQARRMAERNTLHHNPNLGSDVRNFRWVGENVGYGPDAQAVHAAFMNSPSHRDNILDRDYTQVGIGAVVVGGRLWVAEVFRQPAGLGPQRSLNARTPKS